MYVQITRNVIPTMLIGFSIPPVCAAYKCSLTSRAVAVTLNGTQTHR